MPSKERITWIWCALFCAGVLALILSTVVTVIRTYTPLPRFDYWAEIIWLKSYYAGTAHLSDLWRQHNEHRIFFPRLFFLADLFLFHGTNAFLLAAMLFLQACNAALFARELAKIECLSRPARVTFAALILGLFFSGLHLENFVWSFQISFILVTLAGTFSLWALAWYAEVPDAAGRLMLCLLSAFVATHTLSSGLLIWPVLLMLAVGLRLGWRSLLAIAATAVLTAVSFFYGYRQLPAHADALGALRHPAGVLHYVCAYLALPVSALNHPVGEAAGALILLAVVWQVCWFLWRRPQVSLLFAMCIGAASWVTLTAFVTALGRVKYGHPEDFLRYATPVNLLWVSLICAVVSHPCWIPRSRDLAVPAVLAASITLLAVAILPIHLRQIQRYFWEYRSLQDTEAAFTLGIAYPAPPITFSLPDADANYPLIDFLREHRLSIFAAPPEAVDQPLESRYRMVSAGRCRGEWELRAGVPGVRGGATTVSGWGWDTAQNRRPRRVLIADASKVVRGIAYFSRDRTDVAEGLRNRALESSGWFGYVRGVNTAGYRAYAVLSDGQSVCPLSNPEEVPATLLAVYRKGVWFIDSNRSHAWEPGDRTVSFGLPDDVPVVGDWDGSGVWRIGVFRQGVWFLDWNNSGKIEDARTFGFGLPGDIPVVGDWGHTGVSKFGVFRNGTWILDSNGDRQYDAGDRQFSFGLPGDRPIVGDWDGSGVVRIGVFRNGLWLLDTRGTFGYDGRETSILFGLAGDQPVAGDWNGWGVVRLGVFRNGQWILRSRGIEQPDPEETVAGFGLPGDIAVPIPVK